VSEAIAIPHDERGGKTTSGQEIGYDPSPEETKAIKLVEHSYATAKKSRANFDQKWTDYYRMFRGHQWKEQRPSYRHAEVINLVFRAIQSEVPIVMDTRPKIEFVPAEPGDLELAQVLNDVLESDWNDGNWLNKLTEITYESRFYGTGLGSLLYDPKASQGAGRIMFECEDLFCGYPDPYARNVNEKANSFVFAEPTSVEQLKREYPDKKQFIKSDLMDLASYARYNQGENINFRRAGDSRTFSDGPGQYSMESREEALKITLYIHDSECVEEQVKEIDKDSGNEVEKYIQKLKYPNGRKIVTCNGVLLEDGPLEYDDAKFPYLRLVNYIDPRQFFGISEIEQLESPQKIFNKLISFALDVLTLMGNPIWVVDSTSGVDTDNLFNRPGLVVEKEPGTQVTREEGVQLQPYVLQMIENLKMWFDDVSGSNDVSRGNRPEGVTAASAITALQEAQQTRTRQKMRNMDAFLQDMGKMYASRVFQFYDAPRIFRVTGQDQSTRYFKFHVDKQEVMDENGQPTGEIQKVGKIRTIEMVEGKPYEKEEKALQIQGEFDVRVTSGSGLPFEKNRIESQSLALFDRGVIDGEEVLKNIKYPNAEAVMKRMAEKAMADQQAQMDQQAQAEAQKALAKGAVPL
jgi:hypothetical protein